MDELVGTPRMRNLISLLWSEWKDLEQQIAAMNAEVERIASSDPACQRLRQIPGIGPFREFQPRLVTQGLNECIGLKASTEDHAAADWGHWPTLKAVRTVELR
jgi:hypothetical protein